jgi:beta-galactosidase
MYLTHIVCYFLLILVPLTTHASKRESLVFDYGWKFRTGLTDWAAPYDPPPSQTDPGTFPPESNPDYDDSSWWTVQLPHDGLIINGPSREACSDGCSGRSYIPRHVLWYRNSFSLPKEWMEEVDSNVVIFLEFEGSFRNTTVWLNGEKVLNHVCGYTPFRIQLDPSRMQQTVAVFVDPDNGDGGSPSSGSGWWYEGGGLYRHVRLVKTASVRAQPNGVFVKSQFPAHVLNGKTSQVTLEMEASVLGLTSDTVCYQFEVVNPDGLTVVGRTRWMQLPLSSPPKNGKRMTIDDTAISVMETMEISNPQLWTSAEPNLYQVDFVLKECDNNSNDREELDRVSVLHGIRKIVFDANYGFYLNDQRYKIRGFCDHDTFAVVGMALPDRINLFRVSSQEGLERCRCGTQPELPFDCRISRHTSYHSLLTQGASIPQHWRKWSTHIA